MGLGLGVSQRGDLAVQGDLGLAAVLVGAFGGLAAGRRADNAVLALLRLFGSEGAQAAAPLLGLLAGAVVGLWAGLLIGRKRYRHSQVSPPSMPRPSAWEIAPAALRWGTLVGRHY